MSDSHSLLQLTAITGTPCFASSSVLILWQFAESGSAEFKSIIIDGNINTLNNWKHVEAQLEKSSNIFFRITR